MSAALWLVIILLVLLAVRRFLPAFSQAYREARRTQDAGGIREIDRKLAERILAADELPAREEAPFPLDPGEKVYYQTTAEQVRYQGEGRTEPVAEGTIWITDRRFIFQRKAQSREAPERGGAAGYGQGSCGAGYEPGRGLAAGRDGGLVIPCSEVQRVDSLHTSLLEVTYLKDAATHAFDTVWFDVPRPLTLSAILSRFAGFDLVLG